MATKRVISGWMVFYDDNTGMYFHYGADPNCDGAIEWSVDEPILFPDRKSARKAIAISRRWAMLNREKGEAYNTDFLDELKNMKVRPVYAATVKGAE